MQYEAQENVKKNIFKIITRLPIHKLEENLDGLTKAIKNQDKFQIGVSLIT
jgi:hypothetical protein